MSVVDIKDLQISFATDAGAVTAVQDVTLAVQAGEVLAIVGESGSGKTVTARSILGLLPETALTRGAILLGIVIMIVSYVVQLSSQRRERRS